MDQSKEGKPNWRESFFVRFMAFIITGILGPVSVGMVFYTMISGLFGATPNYVPGFFGVLLAVAICTFTAYLALPRDKAIRLGILAPIIGTFVLFISMIFFNSDANIYIAVLLSVIGESLFLLTFAYHGHRDKGRVGILIALAVNLFIIFTYGRTKPFDVNGQYNTYMTLLISALASGNLYLFSYLTQKIKHLKEKGVLVGIGVTFVIFGVIANGSVFLVTKTVNLTNFSQMKSIVNIYFKDVNRRIPVNITASEKQEVLNQLNILKSVNKNLYNKEPDIALEIDYTVENPNVRPQHIYLSVFTREKILMIDTHQDQAPETEKRFFKINDNLMSKINSWWEAYNKSTQAPTPGRPRGSFYRPSWLNNQQLVYFFTPEGNYDLKRKIMRYNYETDSSMVYAKIPAKNLNEAWSMAGKRFVVYDNMTTYLYDLSRGQEPILPPAKETGSYNGSKIYGLGTNIVTFLTYDMKSKGVPHSYLSYENFDGKIAKALIKEDFYINNIYVSSFDNQALVEFGQGGGKIYQLLKLDFTKETNGHWLPLPNLKNILSVRFISKDTAYVIQGQNETQGFTLMEYNFSNQKGKVLGTIDTDEMDNATISPEGKVFFHNLDTWLWEPNKGLTKVEDEFDIDQVVWSPDGKKIAYCLKSFEPGAKIKIYDLTSGQKRYVK